MAIENGFKYCDRLHIRVWDNKEAFKYQNAFIYKSIDIINNNVNN